MSDLSSIAEAVAAIASTVTAYINWLAKKNQGKRKKADDAE